MTGERLQELLSRPVPLPGQEQRAALLREANPLRYRLLLKTTLFDQWSGVPWLPALHASIPEPPWVPVCDNGLLFLDAGGQRPAGKVWRQRRPAGCGCRWLCSPAGGPCGGCLPWFQGLCDVQVLMNLAHAVQHPAAVPWNTSISAARRAPHTILHTFLSQSDPLVSSIRGCMAGQYSTTD